MNERMMFFEKTIHNKIQNKKLKRAINFFSFYKEIFDKNMISMIKNERYMKKNEQNDKETIKDE